MKTIKLENSSLLAIIDDEDFERINQYRWSLSGNGLSISRTIHYSKHKKRIVTIANTIMRKFDLQYDHEDRNFLNNQKYNLRSSTQQQNCFNASKQKGTSSKWKGVCYHKLSGKWLAYIKHNYKRIHIGSFVNEWDAAQAYNFFAEKLFGEFAVFNLP